MDRGGLRLHRNHWSSLLDVNRASTAMAIMLMCKFDMKSSNGFFATKWGQFMCWDDFFGR